MRHTATKMSLNKLSAPYGNRNVGTLRHNYKFNTTPRRIDQIAVKLSKKLNLGYINIRWDLNVVTQFPGQIIKPIVSATDVTLSDTWRTDGLLALAINDAAAHFCVRNWR